MEEAALAYSDLFEGKDKPVVGSTCKYCTIYSKKVKLMFCVTLQMERQQEEILGHTPIIQGVSNVSWWPFTSAPLPYCLLSSSAPFWPLLLAMIPSSVVAMTLHGSGQATFLQVSSVRFPMFCCSVVTSAWGYPASLPKVSVVAPPKMIPTVGVSTLYCRLLVLLLSA